jgi:hypothetical protein
MNRFAQRGAVLAALAWALLTPSARADVIDRELLKRGREIITALRAEGVKNVGVLKFRVQLPKADPRFDVGRLGSIMETRLENVLILANVKNQEDPKLLIGVTRGASAAAAAQARGTTYLTPDGLSKLFAMKYPLAWGKKEVQVDAFLTGLVETSPDMRKTKITVLLYTPKAAEPKVLELTDPVTGKKETAIEVRTTRLQLADMDRPFFIGKRGAELDSSVSYPQGDDDATQSTVAGGDRPPPGPKGEAPPPAENFDQLLDFRVYYNDEPVARDKESRIPAPPSGEAVKVKFTLKAKERVGLVLLVNGENTLSVDENRRDADQYSMWVLEPGREYTISGYYRMLAAEKAGSAERKALARAFKVATDSEATLALADNTKAGKIELTVFREAPTSALPSAATRPPGGLGAITKTGGDFEGVRDLILSASGKGEKRSLVVADNEEKEVTLRTTDFNGVIAAHRTITYFTPR